MSFSPHGWSTPDGLPLLLCKQPIWAAGDTHRLMPVEQGLPWHPVAMGLAGQAIPFVVTASHAHALPSPPFWFPVPAVLVASRASLCPSSLSAVLALVPPGVAPAFCVSVLLLPLSVGAPGCPGRHPILSHPRAPPYEDFTSPYDVDFPTRGWLVTALLPPPWRAPPGARGGAPALVEYVGTLSREGGGGCLLMARSACTAFGGCCSARTSWFPCVLLCIVLGLVSLPCVGRLSAQLLCCLRSSQFRALSFSASMLTAAGVRRRGGSMSLPASHCGCRVVPLAVGWCQGHRALLHMSPNLQTDLSLVFVGVVLW